MKDSAAPPTEVLIVGAGPTGLTAALELTRRGRAVRIIEKNVERSRFSKALGITAATQQRLEACGATQRLLEAGRKIPGATLYRGTRQLGRVHFSQLAAPWNYMLVLPQSETEGILETRLGELGVRVERGVELTDFNQDEARVSATVRDAAENESQIEADWLLGTDGAHSGVRKALDLDFPGETMAGDWSLADLRAKLPGVDDGPTIITSDQRLMFILRIRDDLFRIASNLPNAIDHLPTGSEIHDVLWQSDFTVSHRLVASFRVGRCCLAGDAAHMHSPLGGRGMNLGVEDAAEFARLLDEGQLDDYHALRHAKGKEIVGMVRQMTRLMASSDLGPRTLRRWLLPLLLRLPFATRLIARRMVDP